MDFTLLALETSSHLCEVALLTCRDGAVRLRTAAHDAVGEHAERLLPMADQLLRESGLGRADLDAVAFGQGPGGFTGLRVACGVAQGIAFALDLPVVPVASLHAAAARDAWRGHDSGQPADPMQPVRVLAQDARMNEVYLAAYLYRPGADSGDWQTLQAPILLGADDVGAWLRHARREWLDSRNGLLPVRVLGDGLRAYPHISAALAGPGLADVRQGQAVRASADAVARLALQAWRRGEAVAPDQAAPLYVRDKIAYTSQERKEGLGGNPKAAAFGSMRIEPMSDGDLDSVLDIERSVQSFPWSRRNFQDALQSGYGAWVARQDGAITGFYLAMHAPDVTHLLLIGVAPDAQRRGTGALLLAHCEQESKARGLGRVILEVRPSNGRALAFYGKHGFTTLSLRKDYYPTGRSKREDALVLEKIVSECVRA